MNTDYSIRMADESDISDIIKIMKVVASGAQEPSWFYIVGTDEKYLKEVINKKGFILIADIDETPAAFLIVYYPGKEKDNLGKDLGLARGDLSKVAHMEMVAVLNRYRGMGLQTALMEEAEMIIPYSYKYLMATVHPDNMYSLSNLEALDYECIVTKQKYHGLIRNVMLKER